MDAEKAAWLALTTEEALEPDLPICDPHHHLWDHPNDTYLLDELRADTGSGHNVTRTVFVDCMSEYRSDGPREMRPVGETEFIAGVAAQSAATPGAEIAAIVGHADMALGAGAQAVLEAHVEAGDGRFRGIRHATSWDASPDVRNSHSGAPEGLMLTEEFGKGIDVMARMNLTFDAWMYHPQLHELAALAKAHPDCQIVLDHLGGPLGIGPYKDSREAVHESMMPHLEAIAACENVSLKVGGIGMAIYGDSWHKRPAPPTSDDLVAAWGGAIRWCIEQFSPARCMFESNFPVDKAGCSYPVLWNAFKKIAAEAGYSDSEKADLFEGAAARAYRL